MSKESEKYAEAIRKLIPINELPQQIQNEVIHNANIVEIRKGGFVFKQGDKDGFSYYCLEGEIELLANNQQHNVIVGGSDRATYAMAQLQPRQFSARARKKAVVFQISRDTLDKLVVMHEKEESDVTDMTLTGGGFATVEEVEFGEMEGEVDWMTRVLQSELFSKIPTANIHALFAMLEPVEFKAGDRVVSQGEPGEQYYIIQEGSCQVSRKPTSGDKDINLAVLKAGDSFGEEALITETTRNANVTMITDGILMRLSKDTFVDLIKKPTLHSISFNDASKLVSDGKAEWLDVRFKNEHESSAIPGSMNIPLNVLRLQAEKLDQGKQYIIYCDNEGRSSTGAFLMTGLGFDVSFLKGGLINNPEAAVGAESAPPPPVKEPAKAEEKEPEQAPAERAPETPTSTVDEISKQDIDPDVKSSMLEAELERTNHQLQQAKEKQKSDDEYVKKMQAEVERKLREERAKIEAAKKEAQAEAQRLREQEEAKIKKMQEEAARKLQEEKKHLEEVYSRNTEEMEKLQKMREEAEQKLKAEKEKLEQEALQARSSMAEAQRVKKEIEASKKLLEKEAEKSRKQQEEMEKKIAEEARKKLEEERRKMAEQFATNQEELEQARKEKAAADAARKAAKEEADRIIAEYKAKNEQDKAAADEQLKAERMKLEEEQRKIQETLAEINNAKAEAEAARKAALEETRRLKEKQEDVEITQSKQAQESLKAELKEAEDRINRANKELAQAQQAQVKAVAARKVNEVGMIKQVAMEEEVRKQLEADLAEFKEDLEEEEKKFADISAQMDHMKRIRQRAEEAKNASEQANESLLDEIAAQLHKD